MKKTLSFVLSLIMVFGVLISAPVTVKAASVDDLKFELSEDGASYIVSECDTSAEGALVVPATYEGKPVTAIGSGAFYYCEKLTSIIIPYGVTSFGYNAFGACRSLTSITIPDSVISISDGVFYDCESLTTITIPSSVTSIEDDFSFCEKLLAINVDSDNAIYSSVDGVLFDKNKTTLIKYPEAKTETTYTIPNTVITIRDSAFKCCLNLTKVVIPESVESFGENVFMGCENLTTVNIPEKVTKLPSGLFMRCKKLESVDVSSGVEKIITSAFEECESLTAINVSPQNSEYLSVNGVVFDKNKTTIVKYPEGKTATTYTIPNGVKNIGGSSFYGAKNLKTIKIPDGVELIGSGAFYYCESLESLKLPDTVYYIDMMAFSNCYNLKSINLPKGITCVFYRTFAECRSLKSIKIPDGVGQIGDMAFVECLSLTSVDIPDTVFMVGMDAFAGCPKMTSVKIPESLTNIGYCAFGYGFENGEKYKIPGFTIYGVKGSAAERYANEKGFVFVEACSHSSTKWVTEKKATVNAEGKKVKKCTECGEVLKTETIAQLKCSKPSLKSIENTEYGVKITWGKVSGADKYYVYRKTSGGAYSRIGSTTKTYYTDKTAKSGKKYYYIVKAINEAGSSDSSSSKSIYHLADTTLSTPKSTKSGITLKWSKVTGADGYMVYRKTGTSSYSRIATVKGNSKVTYIDKTAKKGKKYTYKVKAYKSKTYSAYSNAKSVTDKY